MKIPVNCFRPLIPFLALIAAILACGGASAVNVRVTGLPQFVCPTSTPIPTDTAVPTRTQMSTSTPRSIATPMVYATNAPTCDYAAPISYQYICPPNACMPSLSTCTFIYTYPEATANPPG